MVIVVGCSDWMNPPELENQGNLFNNNDQNIPTLSLFNMD